MSSPSHSRQRSSQSATPRRSGRQSQANTPRNAASQLVSSPIFFQSSSPAPGPVDEHGVDGDVSSPLRQMSDSQSTHAQGAIPSSPLRQMSESLTPRDDPQRTPRASGTLAGGKHLALGTRLASIQKLMIFDRVLAHSIRAEFQSWSIPWSPIRTA
jgi:DNA replication licensing factor MCM4